MKKAYLVLSNGAVFEGESIGACGDTTGELVFTTGVVGYLETLTDPCYAGQIVLQTFPLIGNYGVIEEDLEGECLLSGYVVRECCDSPSNFRSEGTLDAWLKAKGVVGISGVDTRAITAIIREEGVMNARICAEVPASFAVEGDPTKGALARAGRKETAVYPAIGEKKYAVALVDYGAAKSFVQALCSRGCEVTCLPYDADAETILALSPDGVLLSAGPGNPAENESCIGQIRQIVGKCPLFGVGLGHQMLALAMGGRTEKLKYGHRGGNQPVTASDGAHTYITTQNCGYAVDASSLDGIACVTFRNANDGTCEGLAYPEQKAFSVQFSPDTLPGDHGTAFLFDQFLSMMEDK